jgi:hypothetical protein
MPYQPGKGMLILATFCMQLQKQILRQRIGYFDDSIMEFISELNGTSTTFIYIKNLYLVVL